MEAQADRLTLFRRSSKRQSVRMLSSKTQYESQLEISGEVDKLTGQSILEWLRIRDSRMQ